MEKKSAAEKVLEAWDAAVEAKHKVEGIGLNPIAILIAAEKGEAVEDRPEVTELIEAYGRLRQEVEAIKMDNLAAEGFPTQA